MAVRDAFKVSRKTFFNPRAWFNYDEFKGQNNALWNLLRGVLIPAQTAPQAKTNL